MRLACAWAPQLALQAVLRREPERRAEPLALAEKGGERARVVALTAAAARAGVRRGMTVAQARAVASGAGLGERLRVVPASDADAAAAAAALVDLGYAFAPRVEAAGERVYFAVGDLGALYPSERAIAQAIAAAAARLGLVARVGIAASKGGARLGAQLEELAVLPAGGERAYLAERPVRAALAGLDEATRAALEAALRRWGVKTLGAFAALPRAEIVLRLGPAGAALHRLACGSDDEPFAPQPPTDALEEGTEIEYPVCEIEPLAFVLRGLLDRVLARLACRGLACAGLELRFTLDPKGHDVRRVPLAAPTRESATVLQLVRLDLARRPPAAPVVAVDLLALPARVRATQLDLWRPAGPAPERLAATIARLSALVGTDNVGAPAPVESFREEAIELRPFELRAGAAPARSPEAGEPTLGFRRFRPPEPVEVLLGRDGPTALRGRTTSARVLVAAGPYRVAGEWWVEDGWSRDYWDVQASDGAVYRVHRDLRDGAWYLDGYYD
jgi:protein ImuB